MPGVESAGRACRVRVAKIEVKMDMMAKISQTLSSLGPLLFAANSLPAPRVGRPQPPLGFDLT